MRASVARREGSRSHGLRRATQNLHPGAGGADRLIHGRKLLEVIDRVKETTGGGVARVTADASYAHPKNYKELEERDIDAVIPPQRISGRRGGLPASLFKYDAKNDVVRCPRKKILRRGTRTKNGFYYRARARNCRNCPLRERCVPPSANVRAVVVVEGYESLVRARRRRNSWDEETKESYQRHRWRVEGVHGEAKTQHGLRRAARRGLDNVAIQVYLTVAVMNLKRLAALLLLYSAQWIAVIRYLNVLRAIVTFLFINSVNYCNFTSNLYKK